MLNEKDLSAIQRLIDASEERMTKSTQALIEASEERMAKSTQALIDASEERMTKSTQALIEASEERMTKSTRAMIDEAEERITKKTVALMDAEFTPKFNLLAENLSILMERTVPVSRVEALEDEVKFLKVVIRQMNEDIQELKQAN